MSDSKLFVLSLLHGALMLPGFLIGLLWHRTVDGFIAARHVNDKVDDAGLAWVESKKKETQ